MSFLYKIILEGKTSYLYGTIHSGEFDALSAEAMEAFKEAKTVALESLSGVSEDFADVYRKNFQDWFKAQHAKFQKQKIFSLDGQELELLKNIIKMECPEDFTDEQLIGRIKELLAAHSPLGITTHLQRLLFKNSPEQKQGGERQDDLLLGKAIALGKRLVALQNNQEVAAFLLGSNFDYQEQTEYFHWFLADLGKQDFIKTYLAPVLDCYRRRDFNGLVKFNLKMRESLPPQARKLFYDLPFTQRDLVFARRAEQLIQEGGAFIAVGAGHLNGMLKLLAEKGCEIKPIPEGPRIHSLRSEPKASPAFFSGEERGKKRPRVEDDKAKVDRSAKRAKVSKK